MRTLRIGVIGEQKPTDRAYKLAYEVGEYLGKHGCIVICGGLGGVMEQVCKGAKEAGGLTIGILPGIDEGSANPWVDIPIVTGLGEARNIIIVRSCQSIIAIEGGYGTLSEISYALKLGKPVIGLFTWELKREGYKVNILEVTSAKEAAELAIQKAKELIHQWRAIL